MNNVLVCLRHYTELCKCLPSKKTLRYRYTLDELLPLLRNLKTKAESFDRWADRVKDALDRSTPKSVDLSELKALLHEAHGKSFPKSDLIQTLSNAIEDAEKCASVIRQLDLNKIRTRNSQDNKSKLTFEELTLFCEEIDSLACLLDEEKIIKELKDKSQDFERESRRLLELPLKNCPIAEVEERVRSSNDLCIELPSLPPLLTRLKQLRWLRDTQNTRNSTDVADIETLNNLLKSGAELPSDQAIDVVMCDIRSLIAEAERWEEKAQELLKRNGSSIISQAEQLIKDAADIDVYLPTENLLIDSLNNANEWFKQLQEMNSLEFYPYLSSIEELIKKSKSFSFQLEEVDKLKSYVTAANTWKEKTSRIFLRKNSPNTLMEALSPRTQFIINKNRRKVQDDENNIRLLDNMDPAAVVATFKDAEDKEMRAIRNLRVVNMSE